MDEEENDERYDDDGAVIKQVPPNWADWAQVFMAIPYHLGLGVHKMLQGITDLLGIQSQLIDDRKIMANSVHEAIESLGDK